MAARYFHDLPCIDDGRGYLPDRLHLLVPRGFKDKVRAAAHNAGVSPSEFVRTVVAQKVSEMLAVNDDAPQEHAA